MYKTKDLVLLRQWYFDESEVFSIKDVKELFQNAIEEAVLHVAIIDEIITSGGFFSSDTIPAFGIRCLDCSQYSPYMDILVYTYTDKGIPLIEMAIAGKGQQIKATELGELFIRISATRNFIGAVGVGGIAAKLLTGHGIAGTVGAGIGAAMSGGFKLAKKGVKALIRDQEAYDKEMTFYMSMLDLGDILIGGNSYGSSF